MTLSSKRIVRNDQTVNQQFARFRELGQRVYFQPIPGNFGDDLIVMGVEELAERNDLKFTSEMKNADHLLIKGGGALLDVYPKLLTQFKDVFHSHPDIPTTLLPTSYLLHSTSMPELVGARSAPLHIYAREKVSYDLLKDMEFEGPVSISLDHDTAFHLQDSDFLKKLESNRTPKHVLIVERIDPEALRNERSFTGPVPEPSLVKKLVRSLVPGKLRSKIYQVTRNKPSPPVQSPFALEALEVVYRDYPQFKDLPIKALDVSSSTCCKSLDEFASTIADSAVVYSTRLHVGILAAMLNIPTYVVQGVYHKISGIYDHTMSDMEHVRLLRNRQDS